MSKLNPQKASAYVGPGVLRKGGKITPVPNGPLVKKKGPFKGSTLKTGGRVIKKAQEGTIMTPYMQKRAAQQLVKDANIRKRDSILQRNANVAGVTREELQRQQAKNNKKPDVPTSGLCTSKSDGGKGSCTTGNKAEKRTVRNIRKNGGMIKRADGSYSRRGLWDNLRSKAAQNKKTGAKPKAPTKAMLTQEKKIKSKGK
jgi:hypothetical protein